MSETTPQQYVAYPRSNTPQTYGTVDQLKALGKAYFGYSLLFLASIVASCIGFGIAFATQINPYLIQAPIVFVVVAVGSYPLNTKLAFGKNWSSGAPIAASLLMGINAVLCCGIIGFVVMQMIASNEIKRYGMATGTFSLTGKKFRAFVEARKQTDLNQSPPFSA